VDATHGSINSADGTIRDLIILHNVVSIYAMDHLFGRGIRPKA
jgi:hypothetical protein